MTDQFTVHNRSDKPVKLEFLIHSPTPSHPKSIHDVYEIPARGSLSLPLKYFRGVFQVRCENRACRDLGYCTKAHAGDRVPAQAQGLSYTPIADEGRAI